MAKITYTNKVKIKDIPVAEVNKFTADNANEIKTIVNGLDDIKENIANKSQTVETDKLSITKYPSVKALYDWAVGKFQSILVSGTNIKTINGTSLLGSGDITISGGGGGDMVLADAQTVSGLKTFLNGAFGLRNVANTFTSFFTNTNTASRTYTLQDKSYTLADNADLTAKANTALTVRKISINTTLAESDNGTVILLTSSCTVTLPNGLSLGFNCSFVTATGATMTYSLGGSIVLINNTATTMAEKLSHTITNTGVLNEYLTVGL
jgi:hypothetical protein